LNKVSVIAVLNIKSTIIKNILVMTVIVKTTVVPSVISGFLGHDIVTSSWRTSFKNVDIFPIIFPSFFADYVILKWAKSQ
jgi:hypothetical protein